MYIGFELNQYSHLSRPDREKLEAFREQRKGRYNKLSNYLIGVFENKEVIDAQKKLLNTFFPIKMPMFSCPTHMQMRTRRSSWLFRYKQEGCVSSLILVSGDTSMISFMTSAKSTPTPHVSATAQSITIVTL